MTDSMNFGPDWIRNLSSEGTSGGGTSSGTRYQLADYRYGREEMLALFERNIKPPACLTNFKSLYSEASLPPLSLVPPSEEERSGWQGRPINLGGPPRGRGALERGGRINRGARGGYQSYGRPTNYEGGWGNGEPSDWSPRKEYSPRTTTMDNWRRSRNNDEDDGWRMSSAGRGMHEKWGRQTSWRGGEGEEERTGPPERGGRPGGWQETNRGPLSRRSWDNEDHLPEWANENPLESGGSFDDRGAFHGSDDEQEGKKGAGLHKSTSQQHISHKSHPPLLTSKSTLSLVKDSDQDLSNDRPNSLETANPDIERKLSAPEVIDKLSKEVIINNRDRAKSEGPMRNEELHELILEPKVEENDFEKLQEDFVSKLVVDEEPRKPNGQQPNSFEMPGLVPPPNLPVPGQDKWFYQDPQGQMQGPFTNMEMCEWSKAGYFGKDLKVRRQCDERFFLLGELTAICGNTNPFQTSVKFPVLKNDISKMPEGDLQFQLLSQLAAYKQAQARVMADPWSAIAVQQQELAAQRLIMQQQQDMQYMPPAPHPNPLMQMISQMQQANKLIDKQQPPNMDPHMHMHMNNFLSLQNRIPMPGQISTGLPLPNENLATGMSSLPGAAGIPMPGLNVPRPSPVEHNDNDPISSLLKQLQQQKQQQVESMWQQNQFGAQNSSSTQQQQWPTQVQQQQQPPEVPISMWDIQQNQPAAPSQPPIELVQPQVDSLVVNEEEKLKKIEKVKDNKQKEDGKELKKKKKIEEEQQKKDIEERRKQEQRKLELDKKAEVERKRKEEEKIKKELEKAKKEAEDKRMRELEEKRRLKEQRKLEEEAKKRTDEERRILEEDRIQREKEQRDREERQKAEERRQEQLSMAKAAPWSQANSTFGMSLADIQKAEKERKAQEAAALQAQRIQLEKALLVQQQQQQMLEKSGFGWAKKTIEPRKVKSLAEIQAEEQERLAKETAEARLKREKEARETAQHHHQTSNSIWSGQSLTWASASQPSQPQWSEFWGAEPKTAIKPSVVSKSSSMSTINYSASKQAQPQPPKPQPQQQPKAKPKKEEAGSNKKNHNNNVEDDFTSWCFKALTNISSEVDVPTFISFLKDIESAFEVREYCKEYLGESNTTQQFANNFLEKRRSFKPKQAHKDDMCSPAPAITPHMHNTAEFQEVKGKNKKNKKSKMLKVDSRILGFNVTSAPDRINVGDRDYGDNS